MTAARRPSDGPPVLVCVDCDRVIAGASVTLPLGDSMSGARPDMHAHPPNSPDCHPRDRSRAALRHRFTTSDPRTPEPS
ncbi:hypothetical protein ACFU6R_17045 [Streptomyces sp. NPDC057499]|uniref:hypothetical protein n=1 Tax=Streptomyces sp. NPDC057499 TaxID=3346150 RepID=UPI0036950A06